MEDIKEKYIGFIEKILSFFGPKRYANYIKIARDPNKKIKTLEALSAMVVTLFILTFILESIPGLIAVTISYVSNYITAQYVPDMLEIGLVGGLTLFSGVILIVFLGIYAVLEFLFAKILGGKGSFNEHLTISYGSYLTMYILSIPLLIISAFLGIMQVIPLLNIIVCLLFLPLFAVGVVELIVGFYGLYIKLIMIKELHKVDTLKAVFIMILPYVVLLVIVGIIIAAITIFGIGLSTLGLPEITEITGIN